MKKVILLLVLAISTTGCFKSLNPFDDGDGIVDVDLPRILPRTEDGLIDVERLIELYKLFNPDSPDEEDRPAPDIGEPVEEPEEEQTSPLPGQGSNTFLWKPNSDSSRGVAILFPARHWETIVKCTVLVNGVPFSSHNRHTPNEIGINGWRVHFFTYYSAENIPAGQVAVQGLDEAGNVIDQRNIPDPRKRWDLN